MREELFKAARGKVNDYEQTVNAMLSFAAFVIHDGTSQRPDSEFGIGRRMTSSSENRISPNSNITPDLVAQKSYKYGIVAEVKKSLDQNESNWIKHIKQLRKYDDNLNGWWTEDERIDHSNTLILIHQSRGRPFTRVMKHQKEIDPDAVGPNTCIVEFNYSGEAVDYYFFRLEFGNIPDAELGQRLEDGINIPLDDVRMSFPNIQYYDSKPPPSLLLSRLWTDIFPSRMEDGKYDEKMKSINIEVSVADVTDELQKAFGSKALKQDERSGEFPKYKWTKEAFERLIRYKLAVPISVENDTYTVFYRAFRNDVLDHFIKLELALARANGKTDRVSPKQIKMFSEPDE
jgi:hypothetical protein